MRTFKTIGKTIRPSANSLIGGILEEFNFKGIEVNRNDRNILKNLGVKLFINKRVMSIDKTLLVDPTGQAFNDETHPFNLFKVHKDVEIEELSELLDY